MNEPWLERKDARLLSRLFGPSTNNRTVALGSKHVPYSLILDLRNAGQRAGSEIVQLYLTTPVDSTRALKAFKKVQLHVGRNAEVVFDLTEELFYTWNVTSQQREIAKGKYYIEVGPNAMDLPLSLEILL